VSVQRVLAFLLVLFLSFVFVLRSFLDDLNRIAHRGYEPIDEDVVRAQLRTVGVQECRFLLDTGAYLSYTFQGNGYVMDCCTDLKGSDASREWNFYDAGMMLSRSLVSTVTSICVCAFV
jgi:hypothetical protein